MNNCEQRVEQLQAELAKTKAELAETKAELQHYKAVLKDITATCYNAHSRANSALAAGNISRAEMSRHSGTADLSRAVLDICGVEVEPKPIKVNLRKLRRLRPWGK